MSDLSSRLSSSSSFVSAASSWFCELNPNHQKLPEVHHKSSVLLFLSSFCWRCSSLWSSSDSNWPSVTYCGAWSPGGVEPDASHGPGGGVTHKVELDERRDGGDEERWRRWGEMEEMGEMRRDGGDEERWRRWGEMEEMRRDGGDEERWRRWGRWEERGDWEEIEEMRG